MKTYDLIVIGAGRMNTCGLSRTTFGTYRMIRKRCLPKPSGSPRRVHRVADGRPGSFILTTCRKA